MGLDVQKLTGESRRRMSVVDSPSEWSAPMNNKREACTAHKSHQIHHGQMVPDQSMEADKEMFQGITGNQLQPLR